MADCPYILLKSEDGKNVLCAKFSEAAGFKCSPHIGMCELHMKAGGWDVPLADVPDLADHLKLFLRARTIGGTCPLYQVPNPLDLKDAGPKLKARCTKDELKELMGQAIEAWSSILPLEGGHPIEVIEAEATELAKVWDIEAELAEVVEKIA